MPLRSFHPSVRAWFEGRFGAPSRPQAEGWPAIARGENVLILAPTGSGKTLAAFLVALGGSVMLTGAINFIVGALALRLKAILGLLRAKFYVQELLSGLLVPITMFPPALAAAMTWLPFQHIAYTPLRIYLGKLNGQELLIALAVQWAWAAALLAFGAWFWDRMARKITVHGG